MQNEFSRRGGSHSFASLEAEALGRMAASAGGAAARKTNPHLVASDLFADWEAGFNSVCPPPAAEEPIAVEEVTEQ